MLTVVFRFNNPYLPCVIIRARCRQPRVRLCVECCYVAVACCSVPCTISTVGTGMPSFAFVSGVVASVELNVLHHARSSRQVMHLSEFSHTLVIPASVQLAVVFNESSLMQVMEVVYENRCHHWRLNREALDCCGASAATTLSS